MDGLTPFAEYNLVIGIVVILELLYLLSLESSVTTYRQFMSITAAGLVLAVIGGPIVELIAPSLIHWVHGIAALLVILGFYDPVTNDIRKGEWAQVLLSEPDHIRQQAEWMRPMDNEILGLIYNTNLILTPSIIAFNTTFSRKEVNRRLMTLADHGLVEKVERGKYQLTRRGEHYYCGQLTTLPTIDNETGIQS